MVSLINEETPSHSFTMRVGHFSRKDNNKPLVGCSVLPSPKHVAEGCVSITWASLTLVSWSLAFSTSLPPIT